MVQEFVVIVCLPCFCSGCRDIWLFSSSSIKLCSKSFARNFSWSFYLLPHICLWGYEVFLGIAPSFPAGSPCFWFFSLTIFGPFWLFPISCFTPRPWLAITCISLPTQAGLTLCLNNPSLQPPRTFLQIVHLDVVSRMITSKRQESLIRKGTVLESVIPRFWNPSWILPRSDLRWVMPPLWSSMSSSVKWGGAKVPVCLVVNNYNLIVWILALCQASGKTCYVDSDLILTVGLLQVRFFEKEILRWRLVCRKMLWGFNTWAEDGSKQDWAERKPGCHSVVQASAHLTGQFEPGTALENCLEM